MCTLPQAETLTIEFKSDKTPLPDNDIIDAVVAFANTEGGDLYLGVEDDGTITGLHPSHQDITRLTAFIANKTVPPVSTRASILTAKNQPVLKISVPKYTSIVASSTGKIQRRRLKADHTPENVPLYPYEIPHRLSSLSLLDFSAQTLPDTTRQDLAATERERLRNIIRTYHGESTLLELDDLELDKALRLVAKVGEEYVPTVTGMLLIGRQERLQELIPTAESSLQIMDNGQLRINETYTMPLLASIEKINNYFTTINQEDEMDVGMFRVPIPHYSPQAFREALVNAYSHRDYSLLGRVRVLIEREGITISNPGGFIQGVTYDKLLDAEPHGRNPVLADCLKRIGLAERSGRGIDRIYAGSLRYGKLLPDYSDSTADNVRLYIPASRPDKNFIHLLTKKQEQLHRDFTIYELMVLRQLKGHHLLTCQEISARTGIPAYKLESTLETLTAEKMIKTSQQGKITCYTCTGQSYKTPPSEINYIKEPITDYADYNQRIMKLANKNGRITRSDVTALLPVSPAQAYRLLNRLKEHNLLILEGKGKYAHYKPVL
ncbi:MAG: putative DNA binding domain-containing protein [Selenomonas sp.]|nr:putative DNA binding domain-containing protein [Selenomonas sp.]